MVTTGVGPGESDAGEDDDEPGVPATRLLTATA
jgi:hypothetical protein